ncbi:MAG: signal peptidase I [Candidatus Magasanikbacteria bacterium]|nr:signal peptidase I [Candidatus Magasanikbacteria bacterium]
MRKLLKKLHLRHWIQRKNEDTLTPQSGTKLFFVELVKLGLFAVITIVLVRYFLFKPFYVRGASMEPNFFDKEYLIIDEITFRLREPQRGEIIVFHYPGNRSEYFLKRIIGLPGERIKIKDNEVMIYNNEHPEGLTLAEAYLPPGLPSRPDVSYTLGSSQVFVLGDNRNSSFDSRFFGPIEKKDIVGRVVLRGYPFNRVKVFSPPAYEE